MHRRGTSLRQTNTRGLGQLNPASHYVRLSWMSAETTEGQSFWCAAEDRDSSKMEVHL